MDSTSRWKRTSVVEQKPLTLKQVIHLMAATKNEQISSFALLFLVFGFFFFGLSHPVFNPKVFMTSLQTSLT